MNDPDRLGHQPAPAPSASPPHLDDRRPRPVSGPWSPMSHMACCWRSSGCGSMPPDVALTEAAVGGGVAGVLLVAAGKRLERSVAVSDKRRPGVSDQDPSRVAACSSSLGLAGCCRIVVARPRATLTPAAAAAKHGAGAGLGYASRPSLMSVPLSSTRCWKRSS